LPIGGNPFKFVLTRLNPGSLPGLILTLNGGVISRGGYITYRVNDFNVLIRFDIDTGKPPPPFFDVNEFQENIDYTF
jgi:hypothetical protein